MAVERIHLVLEPHLMKAFREMAGKNRRSVSGQFAFMVDEEIDRQRPPPLGNNAMRMLHHRMSGDPANRENDSHLPNP